MIITVASFKGGVGKTTTAVVDACGEGAKGHGGSAVQQRLDFIGEVDCLSL